MVDGLPDIHFSNRICEGCVLGKHSQEKFKKGKTQTHNDSSSLDLIHSDLMVPFPHPSINKSRYVLIFFDDVDTEKGVNWYQVQFKTFFNLYLNHSIISNEKRTIV
jgi:hypothetical protein